MAKQKIVRESLAEQIKSILIHRILDGTLAPGDRLKIQEVAAELGTSQAPVREAIRCLESCGYVEHKSHVGALVKTFERWEMEEAYQIRKALELHCIVSSKSESEKLAARLRKHLEDMHRSITAQDVKAFIEADNLFHRTIVECLKNKTMLSMWESLRMPVQVFATIVETSISLEQLYALHSPVVAALEEKDRQHAALLLGEHYREIENQWKKTG
jgi:DNA-binding GntR family transcriptional regulator